MKMTWPCGAVTLLQKQLLYTSYAHAKLEKINNYNIPP
ncbi:hypothetical protein POKO110462_19925 [Pontibacter korlensis]